MDMEVETAEPAERAFEPPDAEMSRLIKDLEHQINHLVRSNAELEEFMRESGEQKELRVAIGENIVTIARRRAILEDLYQQAGMADAKAASMQDAAGPTAAAPEAAASAEDSADGGGVYL